jgi:hypothetical protein
MYADKTYLLWTQDMLAGEGREVVTVVWVEGWPQVSFVYLLGLCCVSIRSLLCAC